MFLSNLQTAIVMTPFAPSLSLAAVAVVLFAIFGQAAQGKSVIILHRSTFERKLLGRAVVCVRNIAIRWKNLKIVLVKARTHSHNPPQNNSNDFKLVASKFLTEPTALPNTVSSKSDWLSHEHCVRQWVAIGEKNSELLTSPEILTWNNGVKWVLVVEIGRPCENN